MEFMVQLGAVQDNVAIWLDMAGIAICLTRGVDWIDVEIKTNIF